MVEGTYWSSKCLIGGPRNVLKVRVTVLVGLKYILKVLVGMLLVVRVFCCPEYQNWQSLMCNEALNGGGGGGGGLDVYLGGDDPINIHERTFIYSSAYA